MEEFSSCQAYLSEWGVSEEVLPRLDRYLDILWEQNQRLNLFSRKMTKQDLVHMHLLDSLLGLPFLPDVSHVTDLGTGGGFPAIPLALCAPDTVFTLVEKSPKKAAFLTGLKDLAPNIRVINDLVPKGIDDQTELVISRAFKPLKVTLELTEAYLEKKGSYLLWKGLASTIQDEIRGSKRFLKHQKLQIHRLQHPTRQVERHLVRIN